MHRDRVDQRRDRADQGPLVVVGDGVGDERDDAGAVAHGVDPAAPDELAYLVLEDRRPVHAHRLPAPCARLADTCAMSDSSWFALAP
ncbi:hypothetical protein D3C72_2437540 [compost metagenome]